jgi:hypothetical protein
VTPLEEMTDEEFERHALSLLQRELGPYGMARFLRTIRTGTSDYTRDRHKWLAGLTIDEILNSAEQPPAPTPRA